MSLETRLLVSSSWFLGGCGSMWVQKTSSLKKKKNGELGQCIMAGVEHWLVWALSSRMVEQVALPCASTFLKSVCPSLRPADCEGGFGSLSHFAQCLPTQPLHLVTHPVLAVVFLPVP